ncbi:unnamed protein product [Strongylus vulgaris]|uniref:Uncharacterized protein n=1 Tax=Strongylus vulgaris TaxID=40348 RepID=A0A3P7J036_STRVU|nr:unnamed protein product [Strongylus vulgaris]
MSISPSSAAAAIVKTSNSILQWPPFPRSQRVLHPYVTQYSDSGFGSALSSGSSCSYLPPPPPYRMRSKQHKIHRSSSDSKYSIGQQSAIPAYAAVQRAKHGTRWNSQCSLVSY